jgi:hypothetical protein
MRGLFNWYYTRLYVNVRPERVWVWRGGDIASEPEVHDCRIEEVRSGHSEEAAEPHAPAEGGEPVWDERINQLGERYSHAVLSWIAPDGFPLAVRVPVSLERARRRILIGAEPAGLPMAEGRACVVAHRHAPTFSWQENFQVRGDLVRGEGGWELVPRKLIGGFELPDESELARYRRNFSKSIRFYRTAREQLKARKARAA